jgi:phosphatidylglycerol:prolipoprotein diacylglycerol transferase
MFTLLHSFHPQPILLSFGPLTIYWYGLFIVLGILAALAVTFYLAKRYEIKRDKIFDLVFWLIIGGLIGARVYDIFLQLPYYIEHPLQTLQIWKGGLAIHGAIIAGLIIIWFFVRKQKINFWKLTALMTPGLALGQAIGRWGNYFNQELFGLPTNLPWGIPIDVINRPLNYLSAQFFHPTFLYESIGNFLIFIILITANICFFRRHNNEENSGTKTAASRFYVWITALYMILYSILRFTLEFIRVDEAPSILGLRWPQIISLIIIILFTLILSFRSHAPKTKNRQ